MQKGIRLNDSHVASLGLLARRDGTRTGYLGKRSSDTAKWQTKWFALLQNLLFYFESDSSSRPSGLYLLEGCVCGRAPSPKPALSAKEPLEKQVRRRPEAPSGPGGGRRDWTTGQAESPHPRAAEAGGGGDRSGWVGGHPGTRLPALYATRAPAQSGEPIAPRGGPRSASQALPSWGAGVGARCWLVPGPPTDGPQLGSASPASPRLSSRCGPGCQRGPRPWHRPVRGGGAPAGAAGDPWQRWGAVLLGARFLGDLFWGWVACQGPAGTWNAKPWPTLGKPGPCPGPGAGPPDLSRCL